ncbi:MAG: TIR domain-containing protein [Moorea sp. SIO2I5]|nr:TIR domain-containing protein [Moorena sp. SIO2I5]
MNAGNTPGYLLKQIESALCRAFPSKTKLEMMLLHQFTQNLEDIARGENLTEIVYKVVQDFNNSNSLAKLINKALKENPKNPSLKAIKEKFEITTSLVNLLLPLEKQIIKPMQQAYNACCYDKLGDNRKYEIPESLNDILYILDNIPQQNDNEKPIIKFVDYLLITGHIPKLRADKLKQWLAENANNVSNLLAQKHNNYKYDVFISYDDKDVTWVQKELIPKLESNQITYIEPLKFELGVPKASLVEAAIKDSRKILLIITKSYLTNYWKQFDDIISISYGLKIGEWRTIPIIVENCDLPERLRVLSYLELYPNDSAAQWERLIKNLKFQQDDLLLDEDGTVLLSEDELLPPRHSFDSNWLNELEAPEGTVKLRSKLYLQRENEATWLDKVLGWGETIRVKGAHQMGKSSLLARMHQRAKQNSQTALYLDFQLLDQTFLSTLDSLLRYIADRMTKHWGTSRSPDSYWSSSLGAKDKLSDFVLEEVLENADLPILLIFDDVDRVFKYDYRDDFFSLIRAWHNDRAMLLCLRFISSTLQRLKSPSSIGIPTLNGDWFKS